MFTIKYNFQNEDGASDVFPEQGDKTSLSGENSNEAEYKGMIYTFYKASRVY